MKPNQNQQEANQQGSSEQNTGAVTAPEAASKRDVQEAERKAEEAGQQAEEAERSAEELRAELEEAKKELGELREVTRKVDKLVNVVYQKGATAEGEPPLNSDMPCMHAENKESEELDAVITASPEGESDA